MSRQHKVKFAITFVILAFVALWVYRGFGTGHVWSVSGVRIPWPRESTENHDCDYGKYSVFQLREDSMESFVRGHPWNTGVPPRRYENDCLTFESLRTARPLPGPKELIWMEGARPHEVWTMYLHVPTRRIFVSIGFPDMAGDLPGRATEDHLGGKVADGKSQEVPQSPH